MQAHVLVPGPVYAHVELAPHPPLFVRQLLMAVQFTPPPTVELYPVMHVQLLVAGPVKIQEAFTEHPPLFVTHLLTAVQLVPLLNDDV